MLVFIEVGIFKICFCCCEEIFVKLDIVILRVGCVILLFFFNWLIMLIMLLFGMVKFIFLMFI